MKNILVFIICLIFSELSFSQTFKEKHNASDSISNDGKIYFAEIESPCILNQKYEALYDLVNKLALSAKNQNAELISFDLNLTYINTEMECAALSTIVDNIFIIAKNVGWSEDKIIMKHTYVIGRKKKKNAPSTDNFIVVEITSEKEVLKMLEKMKKK